MNEANNYKEFEDKMARWKECLAGENRNSVINQLHSMVWNAAIFRVVNEARSLAEKNENGEIELNALLHNFINHCFFENQLLAIRRLTDTYPIEGDRGVFSVISLLKDMNANLQLFTRINMLKQRGLEYDYKKVVKKERQLIKEHMEKGIRTFSIPGHIDSHSVKRRHKEIDVLTGKNLTDRSLSDVVNKGVIEFLISKAEKASEDANIHVNKFIAHSASPESQKADSVDEVKITLGHIYGSTKVLCEIAAFLDTYLISGVSHIGFLAFPQRDQLRYIDRKLVEGGGS